MPSERARPLVAFAVIAVVCGLVISANMLRHPSATTTAVVAAHLSGADSRVEFGTVLAGATPTPPAPDVTTVSANVLSVALRRPVAAPASRHSTSAVEARGLRLRHARTAARHRHLAVRPHRAAQHPTTRPARPQRVTVAPQRGHGHGHGRTSRAHVRKPSNHGASHPGHGHGHGHGRRLGPDHGRAHDHGGHQQRGHAGGHGRH